MKKILKLSLLVAVMALICYFSSQPSYESSATSSYVVDIAYDVYHFVFGARCLEYEVFCTKYFQPIRKLAHFSEFFLLGLLAYINSLEFFTYNNILISIVFSGAYAICDEIHQYFVPGRYCALIDMLIDTSGALCAILLIHLISKKCLKK